MQPDKSPQRQANYAQRKGDYSNDDIELPPMPAAATESHAPLSEVKSAGPAYKGSSAGGLKQFALAIGLLATLTIGAVLFMRSAPDEQQHPNWKHVAAAAKATANQKNETPTEVFSTAGMGVAPYVEIRSGDIDRAASQALDDSIAKNDVTEPKTDILNAVVDGRAKFYQIQLCDSCFEDGDVIQVSINGKVYSTVTLTNQGTTLSIPLVSGMTEIELVGIRDGGGGITVEFQTSQGQYFCRPVSVGEVYKLGVFVK